MLPEDMLKILADVPILAELSAEELQIIAPYWQCITLPKSEMVFSEGDPADALYFILEGELIIYKDGEGAIPLEIARVVAGQFVGEQAVLENSVRSCGLQTAMDSKLLTINKDSFYEIVDKYPRIGVPLLKGIARYLSLQLRKTTGQYVSIYSSI
jgi:CRP-like cAMP-binding protein